MQHARGALLALTDDDCLLDPDYVSQLLAYDAADTGPVLRGGRVVLGDPADLPLSITPASRKNWHRRTDPVGHDNIGAFILGCNMAMRRGVADSVGPFDVNLGSGMPIPSGEDHEYVFRAYCAGVTIKTVPDMGVAHHHGRKTTPEGNRLMRAYMTGSGAIYAKYLLKNPNLCRQIYWDCKGAVREILSGDNLFLPDIGFSNRDKLACYLRGAARYMWAGTR
jgi:GT2 family glycosyltransferase